MAEGAIAGTVDRAGLWAAQTPQAFRLETLRRAMAASSGETVTDEARLCEAAGLPVSVVPASSANLKVTHAEDIPVADALLRARHGRNRPRAPVRTGIGYDAHRFASGRRLVLGGVEIAHDRGLEGHSDADVLLHAIADAVLGAAALGDIGQHFPPSDERFRDADSQVLLREVVRLVREAGWVPGNVDATLLAEAPRIGPHVPLMRERIAACLGLRRCCQRESDDERGDGRHWPQRGDRRPGDGDTRSGSGRPGALEGARSGAARDPRSGDGSGGDDRRDRAGVSPLGRRHARRHHRRGGSPGA